MQLDSLRLAIIGTGTISKRHIGAMAELKSKGLGGFDVTAVCDIDEQLALAAARALEDKLGVRPAVYTDYRRLLTRETLDGADLCLPHGIHHLATIDCLEAGVHVLSEKPLGVTLKASRKMAEAAERAGRVLSTALPSRRLPSQRTVRWLFNDSKLIGDPLAFYHHMAGPLWPLPTLEVAPPRLWRKNRMMSGGRHVIDSGFHYCDTLRFVLGEVDTVYAQAREFAFGAARNLDQEVEDAVFATFVFKNGVVGTWTFGLILPGEPTATSIFYCGKGSLRDMAEHRFRVFHLFRAGDMPGESANARLTKADGTQIPFAEVEQMYLASLSEEEREFLYPHGIMDGFAYEIWEFLEAVRGRRAHVEVDAREGMRTLAVCEAVYESAWSGQAVRVDDVLSGRIAAYQAAIDRHWDL